MERRETKTNLVITAAKTARIVQDVSLKETSRAARSLEEDSNVQDKLEHGSLKESKKQAKVIRETSASREIDQDVFTRNIQGITSDSPDDAGDQGIVTVPHPHFNLDSVRVVMLTMTGFDVGAAFRRLQEEAVPFVNDESLKVSVKKLYLMMSADSIWDTTERLPGMSADAHRSILSEIKPKVIRFSTEEICLFLDLSHELATTGRVRSRALETDHEDDLLQLFQDLSKKLSPLALSSVADNEDTYSHAPKDDNSTRFYIQDKWALTSLAKDTIDLHLREQRTITSIYCLQVFGYQLAIFELRFQAGIYLWIEIGTGYLPRDKNDTHCLIRCMELLNTLKVMSMLYDSQLNMGLKIFRNNSAVLLLFPQQTCLDDISVRQYVHTPPRRDPDHLLPEHLRPQPTNITPSSRRFFGYVVKASTDRSKS
ncbi:hypothetical protein BGZ95_002669 [Linnemannia exigua]|uniref:Uncharacterized protein n=1 Tax=Linnemannia exigua TaxID=604196 RepID=A0AAD4D585_9FUNG|nr:hypothetical protein BGZ95_002669 [Linnemannia exigua]